MTTTISPDQTTCPDWCAGDCRGEHVSEADYMPTSGGLPFVDETGVLFPSVGVALSWDTIDGLDPCISVHTPGAAPFGDAQIDLRPHEARRLAATLLTAADRIEGRA
jgi:hypothetical protein